MPPKPARVLQAIFLTLAAVATGLSISPIIVAFAVAAEFFSAGSEVPYLSSFGLVQPVFLIIGIVAVLLAIAIIWSIARESFAAIGLGIVVLVATPVGCVPGVMVFSAAEDYALEIFSDRSMPLVRAIDGYRSTHGQWPSSLNDLVPGFLAELPTTGIEGSPSYLFSVEAGPCSDSNPWHLSVAMVEFDVKYLIYCPLQDYQTMELDRSIRVMRHGAWVYWEYTG